MRNGKPRLQLARVDEKPNRLDTGRSQNLAATFGTLRVGATRTTIFSDMFGGILRRVISNPDTMDENYCAGETDGNDENAVVINTSQVPMSSQGQVPLTLIHSRSTSSAMSGSTLSEDDERMEIANDDDALEDAKEEEQAPPRRIRRMDSEELSQRAMSSQNSSRDWGWFEDVHNAATQKAPATKRKQRGESADDSVQILRETNPEGMLLRCATAINAMYQICLCISCFTSLLLTQTRLLPWQSRHRHMFSRNRCQASTCGKRRQDNVHHSPLKSALFTSECGRKTFNDRR